MRFPYYIENYIAEIKMNILIVSRQIGSQKATFYSTSLQFGTINVTYFKLFSNKGFKHNFGINRYLFGESNSGHLCLNGITSLLLKCRIETCDQNYILFKINDSLVSRIYFDNLLLGMDYTCYGMGANCPKGTFFNENTFRCDPCSSGCSTCNSLGTCSSCFFSNVTALS